LPKKFPITIGLTQNDIDKVDQEVTKQKENDDQANRSKVIRTALRKQLGIIAE